MSDKISALTEQTSGTLHDDDLLVNVDVSDTTMAASGTNKKSKWSSIKATLKTYFDTLYALASHTHSISDVTSLQTTLDGKAASSHAHAISDVTGLQTALDGKAASSHTHNASDINAGTLDAARLPAPGTTTLGGVKRNAGSAGQYVNGIDTDGSLLYGTPSGGASPPQPLQAKKTDTYSQTSATFTNITGLTQSYTPTSTTQKVMVKAAVHVGMSNSTTIALLRLARDGTAIGIGDTASNRIRSGGAAYNQDYSAWIQTIYIEWLDVPGTTSSVTYSVQLASSDGTTTVHVNRSDLDTDSSAFPRTASTLTVIPFAE